MGSNQGSKPIGFKTLQEITGYVALDDGNIIKVTVNMMKVVKTDQMAPDGMPLYNFATAMNSIAISPEDYKAMMGRSPTP